MKNVEQLITELGKKCEEKHYSLVTAESCTGGGCAYFITKNPHCSFILERGYVVYSASAKQDILDISPYNLQTFGAVSKEVALEMAENALKKSKAQISLAITGIDESSVKENGKSSAGIVWCACSGIDKKSIAKKISIKGNRSKFCETTILESLKILLDFLKP